MSTTEDSDGTEERLLELAAAAGPYRLKSLIEDVPLSPDDGNAENVTITCVEYWDGNLYIGTSAGEVLHFVSIPGETENEEATFIYASRQRPSNHSELRRGVQQIVISSKSNKACILCNGTLSFHTLPELSPAAGNKSLPGVLWIGATDSDSLQDDGQNEEVIMIATSKRIRMVILIKDSRPQLQKDIEFPGCLAATRRSGFACVADDQSYALLDVENKQKIPLFPIVTVNEIPSPLDGRQIEDIPISGTQLSRSSSAVHRRPDQDGRASHSRASSLGNLLSAQRADDSARGRRGLNSPDFGTRSPSPNTPSQGLSPSRPLSSAKIPSPAPATPDKPLPATPGQGQSPTKVPTVRTERQFLKPHVLSPLPTEFLLTTGTGESDPGVGIFVNSDGEVVPRGTLEFSRYPIALALDGGDPSAVSPEAPIPDVDGYIVAAIQRVNGEQTKGLEIQRWDTTTEPKSWLILSKTKERRESTDGEDKPDLGLTSTQTTLKLNLEEISQTLTLRRFIPKERGGSNTGAESSIDKERNKQEDGFAHRFGQSSAHILAWTGSSIKWVLRNPILTRLDASIEQILESARSTQLDQGKLIRLARSIRNQEVRSEAEFVSLDYIRQKISIVLFGDLAVNREDVNPQLNEQVLMDGSVDPRILLSMVPLFAKDIVEGESGIRVHSGLVELMNHRLGPASISLDPDEFTSRPDEFDIQGLVRKYLGAWRQKKGFGSITDEKEVFATVDAALLHLLLHADQQAGPGVGGSASLRAEIYSVVDNNINCWDRAIELLEEYRRLYVLSRLYQSRKMRSKVLETWKRILEGERDEGGEFLDDAENTIRVYLINKVRDPTLVEEYGSWLAKRNPSLGVQVFTDDSAKVRLPPKQVVQLLREKAPETVKTYLEHLVFGKKNTQYAQDLISYYLDNVLGVLSHSPDAKTMLANSYSTYRALEEPKPTYRLFIIEQDTTTTWWLDRLRLLELLGGSHGAGFSYDVARVLERIEPYEEYLVPESIILDGRQGRHEQALKLLTHGLGDYHTAINYCLLGGSSIFHPTSTPVEPQSIPTEEEQSRLFRFLFSEFLKIEDPENRLERTSELLGRFGAWLELEDVLTQIPDTWTVDMLSDFLVSALRRIVHMKTETTIVRALSGAENVRISAELVEKVERLGPHVIPATDTPTSMQ